MIKRHGAEEVRDRYAKGFGHSLEGLLGEVAIPLVQRVQERKQRRGLIPPALMKLFVAVTCHRNGFGCWLGVRIGTKGMYGVGSARARPASVSSLELRRRRARLESRRVTHRKGGGQQWTETPTWRMFGASFDA